MIAIAVGQYASVNQGGKALRGLVVGHVLDAFDEEICAPDRWRAVLSQERDETRKFTDDSCELASRFVVAIRLARTSALTTK
jgi:hypothetical protein